MNITENDMNFYCFFLMKISTVCFNLKTKYEKRIFIAWSLDKETTKKESEI